MSDSIPLSQVEKRSRATFIVVFFALILCLVLSVMFIYFIVFDYTQFNGSRINFSGLKNETLLLINFAVLVLMLSKRPIVSITTTLFLYASFVLISLEKIRFFYAPLLPLDFKYIDQLMLVFEDFKSLFVMAFLLFVTFVVCLILLIKKEQPLAYLNALTPLKRIFLTVSFLFIGLVISGLYYEFKYELAINERGRAHMIITAEKGGLLATFVRNAFHVSATKPPAGYSKKQIKDIYLNKIATEIKDISEPTEKVSLVIYLIESFIDPRSLGIASTKDPIPFFRLLTKQFESGFVYSPVVGGRSANSEFEILTGFSKHFFSPASIPFIDLPYREIPSIATELNSLGYFTKVIQAASLKFFNYQQAYKMLGFQEVMSLADKNVPLDVAGRNPSDMAVVDELIKSSQNAESFFLYAFPNSTHGDWKYDAYKDSGLDLVLKKPLGNKTGQHELRTYLNALRDADKAIKKLITHFAKSESKLIILILGDHQPGMPEMVEQYMFSKHPKKFIKTSDRRSLKNSFLDFYSENPIDTYDIVHRVPYLIWSNFETEKINNKTLGMNELATRIFDLMNHQPDSLFYDFMKNYSERTSYKDLLKFVYLNAEDVSKEAKHWLSSYQSLQYDILLGKGFINSISEED